MKSSANTALVGLTVILAVALLAGIATKLHSLNLVHGKSYYVIADFDDVTGVESGMPVTSSGLKIGSVEKILIPKGVLGKAVPVKVRLFDWAKLTPQAEARIVQPDPFGEKTIALTGLVNADFTGQPLKEADHIHGVNQGGVADLITKQLTQTTQNVSDKMDIVMGSVMMTVGNLNKVIGGVSGMLQANTGAVNGMMKNMQASSSNLLALSGNLREASGAVSGMATDPRYKEAMTGLAGNLLEASKSLKTLSGGMTALMGNEQAGLGVDTKATLAATRASSEALTKTIAGLKTTNEKLNTLLDTSNTTMKTVGALASGVGGVVSKFGGTASKGQRRPLLDKDGKPLLDKDGKPIMTPVPAKCSSSDGKKHGLVARLDLDNRYVDSNNDLHYDHGDVSTRDMNGYAGYHNLFAQFGVDDIGAGDGVNFLVGSGNPNKGLSYKSGAYHSQVGSGVSYRWDKNAGVDGYMYDALHPKYNVYGKLPVGKKFSVIGGVEDVTHKATATVGVGTAF